jgi:hypothetical protein
MEKEEKLREKYAGLTEEELQEVYRKEEEEAALKI